MNLKSKIFYIEILIQLFENIWNIHRVLIMILKDSIKGKQILIIFLEGKILFL